MVNPFDELERKDSKISKVRYQPEIIGCKNEEKKKKLNWK